MEEGKFTQPIERLDEIYHRIRPSTASLWPEVFGTLKNGDLIAVSGKSGAGKSLLMLELGARAMMQNECEVLFIDAELNFNVFKLCEICTKFIDEINTTNGHNLIEQQLEKLHIFRSKESIELDEAKIAQKLADNTKISLVLLDSFGTFYYKHASSAENNEPITKDSYLKSYLEKFKRLAKKFEVTFVYTKPDYFDSNYDLRTLGAGLTHAITLEKMSKDIYSVKIQTKSMLKELHFTIDFYGFRLVDHPAKNINQGA